MAFSHSSAYIKNPNPNPTLNPFEDFMTIAAYPGSTQDTRIDTMILQLLSVYPHCTKHHAMPGLPWLQLVCRYISPARFLQVLASGHISNTHLILSPGAEATYSTMLAMDDSAQ